ncbi:MAG: HAD hydrolase-like protein, partial [Clostridia bacterium]|nr:HAD hydrolase-like protein [Clostridia bacterium]
SNAPYAQQVKRLTLSGIIPYIEKILNFEEQGVNKPQKRFFEECLKAVRPAKKEEVAIIGDSLSADIAGGKSVGITTVWFDCTGAGRPDSGLCDYTVRSLAEIKTVL